MPWNKVNSKYRCFMDRDQELSYLFSVFLSMSDFANSYAIFIIVLEASIFSDTAVCKYMLSSRPSPLLIIIVRQRPMRAMSSYEGRTEGHPNDAGKYHGQPSENINEGIVSQGKQLTK